MGKSDFRPFGLAAHIAGKKPLPDAASDLAKWGKLIEKLVIDDVARKARAGRSSRSRPMPAPAVRPADRQPGCRGVEAGPDPDRGRGPGIGEIKTVGHRTYRRNSGAGRAAAGSTVAGADAVRLHRRRLGLHRRSRTLSDYRREPFYYDIEPIPAVQEHILQSAGLPVRACWTGSAARAGRSPGQHDALHAIYPAVDPGKIVALEGTKPGRASTSGSRRSWTLSGRGGRGGLQALVQHAGSRGRDSSGSATAAR